MQTDRLGINLFSGITTIGFTAWRASGADAATRPTRPFEQPEEPTHVDLRPDPIDAESITCIRAIIDTAE